MSKPDVVTILDSKVKWQSKAVFCLKHRRQVKNVEPLFDTGSLTAYFRKQCNTSFNVELVRQESYYSTDIKNKDDIAACFIREVMLKLGDTPCVYAVSWLYKKRLVGEWTRLSRWRELPLGDFLFNQRMATRKDMFFAMIPSLTVKQRNGKNKVYKNIPARLSKFVYSSHHLHIVEIFLESNDT